MNGFEKTAHRVLTHTGFVFKPVYRKRPRIAAITTTDEPSVAIPNIRDCYDPEPSGQLLASQTTKLLYLQL